MFFHKFAFRCFSSSPSFLKYSRLLQFGFCFLLFVFIFLAPTILKAQIEIAEFKIQSFEAFFNPENQSYWDEIGAFAVNAQQTFIPNFPSLINNRYDQPSIELVYKRNLNVDNIRSRLTRQFSQQFGQPEVVTSPNGFQLSNTGWIIEEKDEVYIVAFPRNPDEGKLIILKSVE